MGYWGKSPWGYSPWGDSKIDATLTVTLPFIDTEFYSGSNLEVTVPSVGVVLTHSGASSSLNVTLHRIYPTLIGSYIGQASLEVTLPMVQVGLHSSGGGASLEVTLPVIQFYGTSSSRTYTTLVVSTKDGSVTTYSNHNFDSYFEFMNEYYGVNSLGIYKLTGDTDAGASINAQFITGYSDFKSKKSKSPTDMYIGIDSNANVEVRNMIDDIPSAIYTCASTNDRFRVRKINFGKGRLGRSIGISMKSSGKFDLSSMTILAEEKNINQSSRETWFKIVSPTINVSLEGS